MTSTPRRALRTAALVASSLFASNRDAVAQGAPQPQPKPQPFRLDAAFEHPSWLKLSGRQRTRFESLNGQFRAGNRPTTEDQWFLRTSLRADLDFDGVGGALELMDGRAYGAGDDGLTNTGQVNVTDLINVYGTIGFSERGRLLVGRYTMSLGSRRFVIRNGYRNTVNTFTGVDYLWQDGEGQDLRLFWTMPVRRRPFDAPSLRDNDFEWDDQDRDLQFFGAFGTRRLDARTDLEAFVFGLHEDAPDSANRRLWTPGVRLHRPEARGDFFGQVEFAFQFGESQASAGGPTLDHVAWFGHASLGYTWDCECEPTVRVAYDYATGDGDPTDLENNRFDRLYGAPRFEYCPTGLWGAIQRSNFMTPELRVSVRPTGRTWLMVAFRDMRLASSRDQWVGAGVQDPTGASGDHVGQHVEFRARYDLLPGNTHVEIGGAYLAGGSFLERAPNALTRGDSRYGYVQFVTVF